MGGRLREVQLYFLVLNWIYNPRQKCWDDFQNSTRNTPPPPTPIQCYLVTVFMNRPNDFSGYRHYLGEGGFQNLQ